jgi:N6-adenosine-specific RNA methylase IME4
MTWQPEYPCIAADPPWNETGGGKIKRGADRHYPLIKKREDILRVMVQAPCWRPAKDAHLWLWVTNNFLPDGLWLMDALGFRYVTNRAWAKMAQNYHETGLMVGWQPQRPGIGQYFFGQHELLLFGVRGRLPALHKRAKDGYISAKPLKKPRTLLLAPRGEHSQKPQQAYDDIPHVSPGPRLEMFARLPPGGRDGWDLWGNEVQR